MLNMPFRESFITILTACMAGDRTLNYSPEKRNQRVYQLSTVSLLEAIHFICINAVYKTGLGSYPTLWFRLAAVDALPFDRKTMQSRQHPQVKHSASIANFNFECFIPSVMYGLPRFDFVPKVMHIFPKVTEIFRMGYPPGRRYVSAYDALSAGQCQRTFSFTHYHM